MEDFSNVTILEDRSYAETTTAPETELENEDAPSTFFTQTIWYNTIIFCIHLAAIFLNSLIIYIVARYKEIRNSVTLCFANFAVTDIFLVLSQMSGPLRYLFGFNISLYIDCRWTYYFHRVTILATAMTMTFLAFDRYRVISSPMSMMHRRKRKIMIAFICIWIAALTANFYFPMLLVVTGSRCVRVFRNVDPDLGNRLLNTSIVVTNYIIPVMVSSLFYIRIFFIMSETLSDIGHLSSASVGKEGQSLRSRRMRGIRTAALAVLWYALCYLPGSVLNMWSTWDPEFPREQFYVLHLATGFPTKLNTLTNPFVYSLSAASFQKKMKNLLLCGFRLPKEVTSEFSKQRLEKRDSAKISLNTLNDTSTNTEVTNTINESVKPAPVINDDRMASALDTCNNHI